MPMPLFLRRSLSLLLLLLLVSLFGCGENDPVAPDPEPTEDPGAALLANLRGVQFTLVQFLNDTRNWLNSSQAQLANQEPGSDATGQILENMVEFSDNKVWMSLLLNTDGAVLRAHPTTLDSLGGRNWSTWPEIDEPLSDGGLSTGPIRQFNDTSTLLYTRSIGDDPPAIDGVVAAGMDFDSMMARALEFANYADSLEYEVFVLEEDGRIVHDSNPAWYGDNLTDAATFGQARADLAAMMIDPETPEGYQDYNANGAPGGSGSRRLAWLQVPLIGDHFWVLALTEPRSDEGE